MLEFLVALYLLISYLKNNLSLIIKKLKKVFLFIIVLI